MFQANQQIGNYTLIKRLGKGGFGEVWLAERQSQFLTKKVAVKLPLDEQVDFETIRHEAELWEQASGHANVLPIIDADVYNGQVVIVSEYADGGSLFDKLKADGKFPPEKAIEMTIGILNGLDYLHSQKIIHRDIKPQNILLQRDTPRLADFGISRAFEGTTNSVTVSGTDAYMAPEAFEGKRNVQTDIWSVGVVLYQLLSNQLPFSQANLPERMFAILTREFEPLVGEIPEKLRQIVQKSLAKLPENRFSSAQEMREELQRALLNISHPTFAPTQVLEKKQTDNLTIEDKSIVTEIPKPAAVVEEAKNSVVTHFVDKTINPNELWANRPTEYSPLPSTVASLEPQFQETVPPTVLQVTELTNQQKRGFHWGFYFLPLLVDLITRLITYNISFSLINMTQRGRDMDIYLRNVEKIYNFELPIEILVYGFWGALFGLIFPQAKWKWGILLNVGFICVAMTAPDREWTAVILLSSLTTLTACFTSFLASLVSPRKTKDTSKIISGESKNERIERWIFYFAAPIIGILMNFASMEIYSFVFNQVVNVYQWRKPLPLLLLDELFTDLFTLVFFGVAGLLLGYSFPKEKWRWGLWLNLINIFWMIYIFVKILRISPENSFYRDIWWLVILSTITQNSVRLILPCITSYLGSRLVLRKAENKS